MRSGNFCRIPCACLLHFPVRACILVAGNSQGGGVIHGFETIREFLCEQLACDESRVTPDTVMLEDLEMEPSDLGDLMLSLEQEFGIEWTDDDLQGIRTVGDLTAFVENQE